MRGSRFCCSLLIIATCAATAPAQEAEGVVATVNGFPITQADVDKSIAARLRPLQQQMYVLRKVALENLILAAVLRDEAVRRKVTVEQLRKELTAATHEISQKDVDAAYAENAVAFGATSTDEAKERLRIDLETAERMRHYREAIALLRERSRVNVLLEPPRAVLAAGGPTAAATGSENAPVTVTEFSDFQCSLCRGAADTLKRVLGAYENNVRVVFRHLPLPNHPQAFAAARAAVCATEQGRFWEYHDALFASESLSADSFEAAAKTVGLDLKSFADCVSAERSSAAVMADVREAKRLGIATTPTFIVNGVLAEGVRSFEQFQQLINPELETTSPAPPPVGDYGTKEEP